MLRQMKGFAVVLDQVRNCADFDRDPQVLLFRTFLLRFAKQTSFEEECLRQLKTFHLQLAWSRMQKKHMKIQQRKKL
jgi:hypothetical protein